MAGPSVINPLKYIINRQYNDGLLIKSKLFKERLAKAKNFYRKDLVSHYGCVNAIEFSEDGELLVSDTSDTREREFKTTPQQWKVILDYLEENPILLKSKFQNYDGDNSEAIQHWKTLANQLNSMGSGMRSVDKWKAAVGRWKCKTKAKASAIRQEQLKTGGGISKAPLLSSAEERLMGLFGWKSVTGDNNRELGFGLLPKSKDTKVTGPAGSLACSITSADASARGDDRRVLLWKIPETVYDQSNCCCLTNTPQGKFAPVSMKKTHNSNIFCVSFDSKKEKIFSGGNDDQVIIHDAHSKNALSIIPHRKPVYGLSVNPQKDEIIATAGEDGRLLLYDIRDTLNQEAQVLAKQKTGFHSVMFNPVNPRFVVSANSEEGIALWDCRKPKEELVHYDLGIGKTSGISACFNSTGKKVLALRRRLPPVLYDTQSEQSICENDEYVLSGSDDFNLYMWRMPEEEDEWGASHMVLRGHRSIVNQVRYNSHNNLIASSGVEKMIKLWSTIQIGTWSGSLLKEYSDPARIIYTHQDYVDLVGSSGERISHDYSDQSTYEDSKMMAFFDSLIQREIEGWASSEEVGTSDSDSDMDQDYSKLLQCILRSRNKTIDEPRKHKHNKIAQLISKKRNRLAKMAYNKAYSSVQRKQLREKRKRKERIAQKQKYKDSLNGTSKKLPKLSSYLETKKNRYLSESSARSLRYRTRQVVREACENAGLNTMLDTPSTSTGITSSSSSVYRVLDQDSDDEGLNLAIHSPQNAYNEDENHSSNNEEEEENLVNILPTPLNGTQEHIINGLEIPPTISNGDGPITNGSGLSNGNAAATTNSDDYNNGASTSTGSSGTKRKLLKRSYKATYPSDSEEDSPSNENGDNGYSTSTDSEFECATPPTKRRTVSQSDSGCGTGPSSTKSRRFMEKYVCFNARKTPEMAPGSSQNGHTSDEENRNERFRKKVRKARVNLRSRVRSNDSDSN